MELTDLVYFIYAIGFLNWDDYGQKMVRVSWDSQVVAHGSLNGINFKITN